ncbi:MAG: hypothetical protein KF802_01420 [Bdellovibrionaceae bacterium]|nr:hypothetical protein [Pseudobdellovibrionaceae bacterium]
MEPRLKSSKKWTALPNEYLDQIRAVFQENFSQQIGQGELKVEGRIYASEVLLRVGLHEPGRLAQANFEVSMEYSAKDQDAVERIHNCVDAAASMMQEFFDNDGEVDFPRTWKPFPFQNKTLYLQFSTENSELEAEADRLLGADDSGMLHGDDLEEAEDALSRAEVDEELSGGQDLVKEVLDEDADVLEEEGEAASGDEGLDDDGQPRMFGGGTKKKSKTTLH